MAACGAISTTIRRMLVIGTATRRLQNLEALPRGTRSGCDSEAGLHRWVNSNGAI
jgi:hypothetical protein